MSGPKILFDPKEWRKGDTIFSTGYDALAVMRVQPFLDPSVPESSQSYLRPKSTYKAVIVQPPYHTRLMFAYKAPAHQLRRAIIRP